MRPEKHQKIRKHQKNKHGKGGQGQSSASKKKSVNDDGKSGSKSSNQKPDNSNNIRRPHGDDSHSPHHQSASTSSSSSEGLKSESGERKSFSRRKIESNWNRYGDIEEDDDQVEMRGADFNVLLAKEEDSSSQFRFKDEQDWQDDVYQEDNSDFLCLNVQSLVTQLQCLPISQRLNIDEEVFTIYEKDLGIQNSREKEIKTDPCLETNVPNQVEKKRKPDVIFNVDASKETFDFSLHKSEIYNKKQSVIKSTINQSEPDRTGISEKNVVSMIAEPDKTGINWKNPVKCTNKAISTPKVQQKKVEEDNDDELDFLLGLDNPINTTRHQNENNQEPETELNKEKEEESILSKPKKTEFVNSKKNEDEGNLEDWLDSILDD